MSTWPYDRNDAAGTEEHLGAHSQTTQATVRYTAAWGWSQKTFALSQSSA